MVTNVTIATRFIDEQGASRNLVGIISSFLFSEFHWFDVLEDGQYIYVFAKVYNILRYILKL